MSNEQKQLPTVDPSKLFEGGDEVTGEQLLQDQYVKDKNLEMKSDVRDPMVIVAMKLLSAGAEHRNYKDVQDLLDLAVESYLAVQVSHKRMGRKEFRDSWVALMEASMRKKEGLADQIFGGSR